MPANTVEMPDVLSPNAAGDPQGRNLISPSGVRIGYEVYGNGPPLVLVHGAFSDHRTNWAYVRPLLEPHFTVFAVARRGRGGPMQPRATAWKTNATTSRNCSARSARRSPCSVIPTARSWRSAPRR